jgi:DNA primase catalytic core
MKQLIEKIKISTSLVDLCGNLGIKLAREGASYKALCPFREETTPSFTVFPDTNRYHCFSCGVVGDVIDLVQAMKHICFKEAVEFLANRLGNSAPGPVASDPHQSRALTLVDAAAGFFHFILKSRLEENHAAITSFLQSRGITPPTVAKFKLGYASADQGLSTALQKKGFTLEELVDSGLVKMDGQGKPLPFFRNRIVFPFLKHGRAFYLTGRSLDGSDPKYLNLRASDIIKKGIYNQDALKPNSGDLLITEGIIDSVIADQCGYSAISLAGLEGTDDLADLIGTRGTHIVFDSEESGAGMRGAEKLATSLLQKGKDSKIIMLPRNAGPNKVDLADFLASAGPEALKALLPQALGLLDLKIEHAAKLNQEERPGFIRAEIFPLICHGKFREMDRATCLEKLKKELGLNTDMFQSLKKEAKSYHVTLAVVKPVEEKEAPRMTDEERDLALQYLRDPQLIQNLVRDIRTVGLVGEDTNAQALYLFSLTRKTDKPVSAVVFGDSSAGKSHLVKSICSLIPDEDKLVLSSASAKSFEHAREDQLKHKFIVLQEIEGMEEVEATLRVIQSEGKLARFVATKNEQSGQIETVHKDVDCPASIITTTTRDHVHPENSTRIFELYVNQTPEQTAQIHELQREKVTLEWAAREKEQASTRSLHVNAQRLVRNLKVVIPFAKFITFPEDRVRSRRDFDRFLSLIQAVALFRQYQKEVKSLEGGEEYIEADLEDYRVAYDLGKRLFASTFSLISDRARDVLQVCIEIGQEGFGRADIRKKAKEMNVHVPENNKTLAQQLRSLEDVDAIEPIEGGKGKAYTYRLKIKSVQELDQSQVTAIPTAEEIEFEMHAEEMATEAEEGHLYSTGVN